MNKNLITALAITGLIIILGIFFIPWDTFFSETTVEYCGGDKSKPIRVFKNPSKAFSVFAQDYEFNFNTGVKVLDSASNNGNISIEAKKGIKEFREKLNQENIQFENLLKTAFYAYNQDGCNEEVKRKYWDILNTMSEKILKLEKLKNFNETIKEVEKEQTAVDETPKADTSNSSKANINDRKKNIKKSSNVQSIPPTIKDKTLDVIKAFSNNYFDEQWVKEGYYIVFGEIKIKLEKFENNNTIAVLSTCQTATSNNCAALESNIRVAVDKNYKFNFNGYVYKIVLQKIDHAGKDPNTLAAYISLIKEL